MRRGSVMTDPDEDERELEYSPLCADETRRFELMTESLNVGRKILGTVGVLTPGESKDAEKAPGEVLSSGSIVRRGEGNGVVMLTRAKTYFGRTTLGVKLGRALRRSLIQFFDHTRYRGPVAKYKS